MTDATGMPDDGPPELPNCQPETAELDGWQTEAVRRAFTMPRRLASLPDCRVEAGKLYRLAKSGALDAKTVAACASVLRLIVLILEHGELEQRVAALEADRLEPWRGAP